MGQGESLGREEVYATVDQRILGEEFVEKVAWRMGRREVRGKRRYAYTLPEITEALKEMCGATLRQLRDKGRDEGIGRARKVMSLTAKDSGYKGQEIAGYLDRDPSVITRYLKEGERFKAEVERIYGRLSKINDNKQISPPDLH